MVQPGSQEFVHAPHRDTAWSLPDYPHVATPERSAECEMAAHAYRPSRAVARSVAYQSIHLPSALNKAEPVSLQPLDVRAITGQGILQVDHLQTGKGTHGQGALHHPFDEKRGTNQI